MQPAVVSGIHINGTLSGLLLCARPLRFAVLTRLFGSLLVLSPLCLPCLLRPCISGCRNRINRHTFLP
jgi:hypothetical protein